MWYFLGVFSLAVTILSGQEKLLSLGDHGKVRYIFDQEKLVQIDRLDEENTTIYSHSYHYGEDGRLISEDLIGCLGEVVHQGSRIITPFGEEVCHFDESHHLVKHIVHGAVHQYEYNSKHQIVVQDDAPPFQRDEKGDTTSVGDSQYFYDDAHQLIKVVTPQHIIEYEYDPFGNRVSRRLDGETEYFVYSGMNEIAILNNNGELTQLRIPGISIHPGVLRPIAIETQEGIFAPIHDYQGKIIKLINIHTKEEIELAQVDPFGRGIPKNLRVSWLFSGKNCDAEAGLVHFGKRYYCPDIRAWMTPDPLKQTDDAYEFCLGNPLFYFDPDGEWAVAIPLITWTGGVITSPLWGPAALGVATCATIGYLGYKSYLYVKEKTEKKQPPYTWDDLGSDPSKCPDKGFKWKGKGTPQSGKGNWVRGEKPHQEKLNPDLDHPDPIGPHWDYEGPDFTSGVRIKPDGTWEIKAEK